MSGLVGSKDSENSSSIKTVHSTVSLVVACMKVTQHSEGPTEVKALRNQVVTAREQHERHNGFKNCGVEWLMLRQESLRSDWQSLKL